MNETSTFSKLWAGLVYSILIFQKQKRADLSFLQRREKMKGKNDLGTCIQFILH